MTTPTLHHPRTEAASGGAIETPTVRGFLRRSRTWIIFGVVILVAAVVLLIVQGGGGAGGVPLGADNPAPAGAKAIVQVLRGQGVDVEPVSSLDEAVRGADDGATVLLADTMGILQPEQAERLAAAAERLIVVAPSYALLGDLTEGVRLAGSAQGPLNDVACDLPAAERAGELSEGQQLLRIDDQAIDDGWSGCFADGEFGYALAIGPSEGGELTLVGSPTIFANETIDEAGNAALALGLTGQGAKLVWYLPGLDDLDPDTAPPITALTPGWLSPVVVLAILVTIAAGIWRGRRFGPLVVEDLPVEVPAAETREGRARLYARSAVRTHAVDQLRIGSLGRLAALLKLPTGASTREIAAAAALATATDPRRAEQLLVDALPATDRELVDLAAALGDFEESVRRSLHPDQPSDRSGRRP